MQNKDDNKDLYQNIRQARLQLSKLKEEAAALEANPYNIGNHNMRQYMKNVAYSLNKNDESIDKKIADYKSKFPSIHKSQKPDLDLSLGGFKKYRKNFKHPNSKRVSEQSTKIDNSISFSVQNRPMKIYSNHQKHVKPEYSEIQSRSKMQLPSELLKLKQQTLKAQKNEISMKQYQLLINEKKRNFSSHKKRQRLFEFNSSGIQQSDSILRPPSQMEYVSVVDKYSKHEFMIIKGKIANEGPEYASYSRIYQSIFGRIKEQIVRLEDLLRAKSINYARFDGKKLAYLCLKKQIKKSELIDCLVDEDRKLKHILLPSSKYVGKKGRQLACIKIQSYYKMYMTRQKYLHLKRSSIIIQKFFKKKIAVLQLQKRIHERNSKIMQNFENRQEELEFKWRQIKNKKRVEIHLNSIEVDQEKRLSIQNFNERQNIQLSRIFRLKDDNLILIYVTSSQLSHELINYYYKMLNLAGIPKYQDRLLFFTPNTSTIFPEHFSVSKLLYYSSKTLNQLKIITEDLPTLLFPGYPSNQLIKICDFLNCYLYSGSPQKMKPFTSKSQVSNFLKNLSIPCLPSAMEMYDYGEFLNTFSVLIMKNPQIQTWILKIDDEFEGRGVAYLNVSKMRVIQNLLNKVNYPQNNQQFFATNVVDTMSQPQNQQITIKIRDYLRENLPERLRIATPTVYRSYSEFIGKFIKKGGIIQAKPVLNGRQVLCFPCVSFSVDPLGQYQIVTSYQKILGTPYRSYACSFPQKSMNMKQANSIIRQICQSFKVRKIFGYFTVDFIVVKQGSSEIGSNNKIISKTDVNQQNAFWVLDIDPYLNNFTSSFYLFDVLMGGKYFPEKNMYLVEKQDQKVQVLSAYTRSSEGNQTYEGGLIERSYTFIPHFFNQNMFMVKINEFFKQARIERFNFDIGNKQGICIILLDSLTSGTMSMMSVGKTENETANLIKNVLQFIARISCVKNVSYGRTDCEPSSDKILLKDMLNLFMTIMRKDERSNAKAKAIKQFENNQKLELIF